jgi:hypothetical protein
MDVLRGCATGSLARVGVELDTIAAQAAATAAAPMTVLPVFVSGFFVIWIILSFAECSQSTAQATIDLLDDG